MTDKLVDLKNYNTMGFPQGRRAKVALLLRSVNGCKVDCFAPYSRSQWRLNILKVDKKTEDKIVGLADKVIKGKKDNIDTSELENEIDKIVYVLYGLSEEEIKIVQEGK